VVRNRKVGVGDDRQNPASRAQEKPVKHPLGQTILQPALAKKEESGPETWNRESRLNRIFLEGTAGGFVRILMLRDVHLVIY
jgi:hypothetical protein